VSKLCRPERKHLGAAAALAALLAAATASAAERSLALEVIMNGRSTGRVGEFIDRDGVLYARPSELRDLGFAVPQDMAAGTEPIPLSALPNVQAEVNEAQQTLVVVAGDAAQEPTKLGSRTSIPLAPLSTSGYGAVLNYDILGTFTGPQTTGAALLDFRAFSPYGVLQSTGLANLDPNDGQKNLVRLDTTYTFSEPDDLRQWLAGDVVSGALSWSRSVRLEGAQVASDFALRPDLVTYPLPVISSSTAVPSTVNVVVNGIRQFSEPVQPGPFVVQTLPVVTGAGEVGVAVQDALGRQTFISLPFYASSALLKPGLASYSLEAGTVRQNYGLDTERDSDWALSGSSRYGVTDWLTVEGHGEAANELALFGVGAALQVGTIGIFNAAVSGSTGRGGLPSSAGGRTAGPGYSAGFQRISQTLSFGVSGIFSSGGYRDIAAVNGSPIPKSTLTANIGYEFGTLGDIGIGYLNQMPRTLPAGLPQMPLDLTAITNPKSQLATASYTVQIVDRVSFYATGFKDLDSGGTYGAGIGIRVALGGATSASVGNSLDGGHSTYQAGIAKSALEPNDYGYRLEDSEGAEPSRLAEGQYISPWGQLTAGVGDAPGLFSGRLGASGALTLLGGNVFASDQIFDSFAVVQTGDVTDVPVLYQNRPAGSTGSDGQLLVPSLLSYQNNRLSVDATRLPPDIEVGQTSVEVRPPNRSGVIVDFHIQHVSAALLQLQDRDGQPLPLGSVALVEGAKDQPVGYDGEAYVTGLRPMNDMAIALPDGKRCVVHFAYKPVKDDIPIIGPLVCR
jgi:outer membrane usher protein